MTKAKPYKVNITERIIHLIAFYVTIIGVGLLIGYHDTNSLIFWAGFFLFMSGTLFITSFINAKTRYKK